MLGGNPVKQIFVNLKRFDVPKKFGGLCPKESSDQWIEWVVDECIKNDLGKQEGVSVSFILPESLIITAVKRLQTYPESLRKSIEFGSQGVYREDVSAGGNFGAFSTNRPSAAVRNLGCNWTMIGHSEERKDKLEIIATYAPATLYDDNERKAANSAVDSIMNQELKTALNRGIKVLFCIGETAEEKGEGEFEEQKALIAAVLRKQLVNGLKGLDKTQLEGNLVIGYEPIWAIGPGKMPPGSDYIEFVSASIKHIMMKEFAFTPDVVYGGGLKEENAGVISKIATIDGGLVALTRFTGEIGFYPEELKKIIDKYLE